jgi:uncharacterized protein YceK
VATVDRYLVILTIFLAGCAAQLTASQSSQSSPPSRPPVNLSGYSAAFQQGYTDGCASVRGSIRRDEQRYQKDADYMMGWSDGHSVCGRR